MTRLAPRCISNDKARNDEEEKRFDSRNAEGERLARCKISVLPL